MKDVSDHLRDSWHGGGLLDVVPSLGDTPHMSSIGRQQQWNYLTGMRGIGRGAGSAALRSGDARSCFNGYGREFAEQQLETRRC